MNYEFKLPDLGEGIAEGEIVRWLVKEGDMVEEHQPVVEIETDKAVVEVPSPKKGKVLKLGKSEGEMLNVGEVLIILEQEGGEAQEQTEKTEETQERDLGQEYEKERPKEEVEKKRESFSVVGTMPEGEEVLAAPRVRSLARNLGVDIAGLSGSGVDGSITEEDVRGAAEGSKEEKREEYGEVERVPLTGIRKSIARKLVATQKSIAFATAMDEADITRLWELKESEKVAVRAKGVHLTLMPFFIKAALHALSYHPTLNASVDDDSEEVVIKKYYDFGVAVDTAEGLVVPVIRGVERLSIVELAGALERAGNKARQRRLTPEEMKGSSFTISNYGSYGGTYATPIINSPDIAILGTGRVKDMPWAIDGEIKIRKILHLSLTFDHRIIDGGEAASFLGKVVEYLEDPGHMLIESS